MKKNSQNVTKFKGIWFIIKLNLFLIFSSNYY